jgi:hypothetical protein
MIMYVCCPKSILWQKFEDFIFLFHCSCFGPVEVGNIRFLFCFSAAMAVSLCLSASSKNQFFVLFLLDNFHPV